MLCADLHCIRRHMDPIVFIVRLLAAISCKYASVSIVHTMLSICFKIGAIDTSTSCAINSTEYRQALVIHGSISIDTGSDSQFIDNIAIDSNNIIAIAMQTMIISIDIIRWLSINHHEQTPQSIAYQAIEMDHTGPSPTKDGEPRIHI